MDNFKRPSSPVTEQEYARFLSEAPAWTGFTKLELASIMIAQGMVAADQNSSLSANDVAKDSVNFAKSILAEANK